MAERPPEDVKRRLRAKRLNEQLKLTAATANTIGLTILGAAALLPLIGGSINPAAWVWILVAGGLHLVAHVVLRWLKSED